jgi:AraC family transcriptional regulator of adaptative response/methylated-DNA-[protein]-cysteine methyltransferase
MDKKTAAAKRATPTERSVMLAALMERDGSWDGLFYAGITTTMIFCRPSCPARKPKPEHVQFFPTAREALYAGFRPCRRCRPLRRSRHTPDWVVELLGQVDDNPKRRIRDADLRGQGLDPATVRRYFQKTYGMTFQAYSRARRLGDAFAAIRNGSRIDDAVFDHDWESHSGFREAFTREIGAPPGSIREGDYIRLAWIETPLGPMAAGATQSAICLLEFTDRRMLETQLRILKERFGLPVLPGDTTLLQELRSQLAEYFRGERQSFDLSLDYPGTAFQQRVWDALLQIPYGQTRSYADLARMLGVPGASRAVGRANGSNRLAILLPCHRVIASDGSLGGYGGGLWRKLRLLEREGAALGSHC